MMFYPGYINNEFQVLDDPYMQPDSVYNATKYEKALTFFSGLNDPYKIFTDIRAYNSILIMNNIDYFDFQSFQKYHDNMASIIAKICFHYGDQFKMFLDYNVPNASEQTKIAFNYQFDFMNALMNFVSNLAQRSKAFSIKFQQYKGILALLNYFSNDEVVKRCIEFKNTNKNQITVIDFFKSISMALLNLTYKLEAYKKEFEELRAVSILEKLVKVTKNTDTLRTASYLSIINITSEEEIARFEFTKIAVKDIIKMVKTATKAISDGKNLMRKKISFDVDEETETIDEICCVLYEGTYWNLYQLLTSLYRIAFDDKMKYEIYETYNMKEYLEKTIANGNEMEKVQATKLLWQLCFDQQIAKKVRTFSSLFDSITSVTKQANLKNINLKKYCEGVLWSTSDNDDATKPNSLTNTVTTSALSPFRRRIKKQNTKDLSESPPIKKIKDHIMISYNSSSRQLCLKIKNELEKLGHNVWIDVERIHGSSLESMANAVEDSKCVLMCVTEKYKQSPNCRAEAEYAFNLKKTIIPLVMESNYKADGWLGLIIGAKIYVDFTKFQFEEAMELLKIQIRLLIGEENETDDSKSKETEKIEENINQTPSLSQSNQDTPVLNSSNSSNSIKQQLVISNPKLNSLASYTKSSTTDDLPKLNNLGITDQHYSTPQNNPNIVRQQQFSSNYIPASNSQFLPTTYNYLGNTKSYSISNLDVTLQNNNGNTKKPIEYWNEFDVTNCLVNNKFSGVIVDSFKIYNGMKLKELNLMRLSNPNAYYHYVNPKMEISYSEIMRFTNLLENLFQNN